MDERNTPTNDHLASQLHQLIQSIELSGRAVLPRSNQDLLQSIVEAAARIFGAGASSIALVDEESQELEFKVAYNVHDKDVVGMRIPIDKGIAGYVAMTGQPLAISNVEQDARFNLEFAKETGYVPNSILAMPLLFGEKVIGVMEILDKIDSPSFGLQDMKLLSLFAHQATLAIHQSQQFEQIGYSVMAGLRRMAGELSAGDATELAEGLREEPADIPSDLLELADIFRDIASLGESERRACLRILEVFQSFRKTRTLKYF